MSGLGGKGETGDHGDTGLRRVRGGALKRTCFSGTLCVHRPPVVPGILQDTFL